MAYTAPTFVNNNTPAINATNLNNLAKAVESLGIENGGTGKSSFTDGAILVGNGTDPVDELTGTGAVYATAQGSPQFGTLPVNCGGTGYTSLASLRANIAVFQIRGTAPNDTNSLWINPNDNSLSYYYNGSWRKIVGVYGV
jgi:hypothetical protein